jgi:hypothetical protein
MNFLHLATFIKKFEWKSIRISMRTLLGNTPAYNYEKMYSGKEYFWGKNHLIDVYKNNKLILVITKFYYPNIESCVFGTM